MITIHRVSKNYLYKGCIHLSKKSYYYVSGNTSQGYVNFLSTNVQNIKRIIVLKHQSHTLKTRVLQEVINDYAGTNQLEIICSAFGNTFIDGVIMRDQSLAIVTDSIADPLPQGAAEIDLTNFFSNQLDQQSISKAKLHVKELSEKAYDKFSKGLRVHDDLEAIYIKEMNFDKANQMAQIFIEDLFKGVSKQNREPVIYHRFFGTNTAQGAVNILPKITKDLSRRVYVKGRAGTGKSVFMKKVAAVCEDYGFDVERYHCSFDPDSIDMIVVRELDFCMFDSTDPHEFFPERDSDVIVDLYKQTVTQGTDEKYSEEIKKITKRYKAHLQEGMDYLKQAKNHQDKLDKVNQDIDQAKLYQVTKKIFKHIL